MKIVHHPRFAIIAGAVAVAALAVVAGEVNGSAMADRLEARTAQAIAAVGGAPVEAHFRAFRGMPSRHPLLTGAESLNESLRDRIAKAIASVPGVGGLRWSDGTALAQSAVPRVDPLHCQEDVEALLNARTIRFEESSTRIDAASRELVDEVAAALRPCLGSIIAITGHTDSSGPEPGNLRLSQQRAGAVREALIRRGIPDDGLRARGVGSSEPVPALDPIDPANRRIEFSVVATMPVKPTPVDTPGPR